MNVPELPPFLLEPLAVDREREDFMKAMSGKPITEFDGQVKSWLVFFPLVSSIFLTVWSSFSILNVVH